MDSRNATRPFTELLHRAHDIGKTVLQPFADAVDREGRFPEEGIAALRRERLLSAAVPPALGGDGCTIGEIAALCEVLGQYCASTGMIFAMHQIQVGSLVRHGFCLPYFSRYLADLVERQYLIASVTSEVGVGGDLRFSKTAIQQCGDRFVLNKRATTISYGGMADTLLITARRTPDSAPGDQALVLVHRADCTLTPTGNWDTLGMRGTCSPGFELQSTGAVCQILPDSFADIAALTMVPWSHLLWASLWLGMARDAVQKARAFVRAEARKQPGTVPSCAQRLASVVSALQNMEQSVHACCTAYEQALCLPDPSSTLSSIGFALHMNNLKVSASQQVAQIALECLAICGIAGYRNDSPYALGRTLRDSLSAALMIGNDRILATNAALLLVYKNE